MERESLTLSVREASRWLGVGRDEGYRMVADGRLPALRVGARFRIPRSAVVRLIEALCAEQRLPGGPTGASDQPGAAAAAANGAAGDHGETARARTG